MRKINLKGKVVALRPLRPSDSSRIYELVMDPEILRNTTIPPLHTCERRGVREELRWSLEEGHDDLRDHVGGV